MGTDLDNVLEDIEALREHFIYFAECRGACKLKYEKEILAALEILKDIANKIEESK